MKNAINFHFTYTIYEMYFMLCIVHGGPKALFCTITSVFLEEF